MSNVVSWITGDVGNICIESPPNNFFTPEIIRDIVNQCYEIEKKSPWCIAIVISSVGKNFCAGMDMSTINSVRDRYTFAESVYREASRLFGLTVPLIAVVQGAAVGGGMGLACACDFRVATHDARFVPNFTKLGIHPGFALSRRLPQIIGERKATDVLMRSVTMSSQEAADIGLVDVLVEKDLGEGAMTIVRSFGELAPLAVRAVKGSMNRKLRSDLEATLRYELLEQNRLWATADATEGIQAFRDRRLPRFEGR
ncbi:enoyl-CoA hydratase/isomerase family protein [Nesterenkonia muleiensis]|uniref:enoyl-CoA hydratase/isomerase family protein n=1 Tax=Nesterenkonia muleiensis TaxID=2282648 RepID=UPI000E730762|nr:enoyl-CoA hydratase/isomerase family protein [Nesterenkonia muleiensis]